MNFTDMVIKNLKCSINLPNKLEDNKIVHSLPPYATISPYLVDMYSGCPNNWMHGSDMATSYFVEVEENKGMWLDFNDCFEHNNDVAIVISIQGINPITGQKTDKLRLEQYKEKCPVHSVSFESERFCPECKYKWPAQNYLTTTSTSFGLLWLDGFKTPDGTVKQYVFTEELIKGIAHQLIGGDKTYSIGIAFYISKKEKDKSKNNNSYDCIKHIADNFNLNNSSKSRLPMHELYPMKELYSMKKSYDSLWDNNIQYTSSIEKKGGPYATGQVDRCSIVVNNIYKDGIVLKSIETPDNIIDSVEEISHKKSTKKLEIGAGSLIKQQIYEDDKKIDYWEKKPYGMIYINYCDKITFDNIIKVGKREEKKNGFMENLKCV